MGAALVDGLGKGGAAAADALVIDPAGVGVKLYHCCGLGLPLLIGIKLIPPLPLTLPVFGALGTMFPFGSIWKLNGSGLMLATETLRQVPCSSITSAHDSICPSAVCLYCCRYAKSITLPSVSSHLIS